MENLQKWKERETVKDKILEILIGIGNEGNFEKSQNLLEDELLDSFGIIALVGALEEEFDIDIDGGDILPENFINIEAIVNLVTKTLESKEE